MRIHSARALCRTDHISISHRIICEIIRIGWQPLQVELKVGWYINQIYELQKPEATVRKFFVSHWCIVLTSQFYSRQLQHLVFQETRPLQSCAYISKISERWVSHGNNLIINDFRVRKSARFIQEFLQENPGKNKGRNHLM